MVGGGGVSALVRITQIDGKLPNLALMRLAAWHRHVGDDIRWERGVTRRPHEPTYDIVYGSAIFASSAKAAAIFEANFPGARIGGTGGDKHLRIDKVLPPEDKDGIPGPVPNLFNRFDYSAYPDFTASIGYTMRGCRFKCGFCIVPKMEGAARSAAATNSAIYDIWRGDHHPKHLHLLDNDFFGNPDWRSVVEDVVDGKFKVCINQGINVRLLAGDPWNVPKRDWTPEVIAAAEQLADEQCRAIVRMKPRDMKFNKKKLYCAWDNIGDEEVFFRGIDRLERAGWKPQWVVAYMLVGYDPRETWERIRYRFDRMIARGVEPYVMVFGGDDRKPPPADYHRLKQFQRWSRPIIRRNNPSFDSYDPSISYTMRPFTRADRRLLLRAALIA